MTHLFPRKILSQVSTYRSRDELMGLAILVLLCIIIRIAAWLVFNHPFTLPDTGLYWDLADRIHSFNLGDYNGSRTPGYPFLLLLGGMSEFGVWIIQSILGIATSATLYLLAFQYSGRIKIALALGVAYSILVYALFYEASLLTQSLATFLFVVSVIPLMRIRDRRAGIISYFLLGIIVSLEALTRPLFAAIVPIYFISILIHTYSIPLREKSIRIGVSIGVVFILIGGWSAVNKINEDYFGLTTLLGYNLTSHSGGLMEYASEEYAEIRDIYLYSRDAQVAETGSYVHTIWNHDTIGAMQEATGLSFGDLSKELTQLSLKLFVDHPFYYMKNVLRAIDSFWFGTRTVDGGNREIIPGNFHLGFLVLIVAQSHLLVTVNTIYMALAIYMAGRILLRRRIQDAGLIVTIMAMIITSSVVQGVTTHTASVRYSVPFQPLILYTVFVVIAITLKWDSRDSRSETSSKSPSVI